MVGAVKIKRMVRNISNIKCKIKIVSQIFPKNRKKINSGDWAVLIAEIQEFYEDSEIKDCTEIKIMGEMPEIQFFQDYKFCGTKVENNYGVSYELDFMCTLKDFKDEKQQKEFLRSVLTENEFNLLMENLEDPIYAIAQEDIEALTCIKGIGATKANKLINKYKDNLDYSELYVELSKVGLTKHMIGKLVEIYKSPERIIDLVLKNPYALIDDVNGISFAKADAIALSNGIAHNSEYRIKGFTIHFLKECGQNGNSFINPKILMKEIKSNLKIHNEAEAIRECIKNMIIHKELWVNKDKTMIALRYYYDLEKRIFKKITALASKNSSLKCDNVEEKIKKIEDRQGWRFTDEQLEYINMAVNKDFSILTGGAGCVDMDTEFFTGTEWKKISDYKEGDKVLQYNEDGTAELVYPERYHKYPAENLTLMKSKYGVSQCLCDEHNVVYLTSKGNIAKKNFKELKDMHNKNVSGFRGRVLTTFTPKINTKIDLTDDEIRVMVAVIADGTFTSNSNNCRISLKKDYKKERLKYLLQKTGIEYKVNKQNPKDLEFLSLTFYAPIREKVFSKYWYKCSLSQLKVIFEEVRFWGSNLDFISNGDREIKYSTSKKDSADFIQYVFSSCGYRSSVILKDRIGQNEKEHHVVATKRNKVEIGGFSKENKKKKDSIFSKYKTKDGFKYCFTVPSGMLVLRRDGDINITGNCGKTSTVNAVVELLSDYNSVGVALAGKAADRLGEITSCDTMTIHRLLEWKGNSFNFNESNQITDYDIFIIDEASMIGGKLFDSLLRAISYGSKIILIGDDGQLESIGECNIFPDLLTSNLPIVKLNKIHRQAKKSAIISESIKVRNGIQLIESNSDKEDIRGELKDFKIMSFRNKDNIKKYVINRFREVVKKIDIMDIQVISPMRIRGNTSVFELNQSLQAIYNPFIENKTIKVDVKKHGRDYQLREGDKIVIRKNNYKTVNIEGKKYPIYNGNTGIVETIDEKDECFIIRLKNNVKVVVDFSYKINIELGYAISVHSAQGSQYKVVIGALDYSSYILLTKELLYTLMTRASKRLILCAENKALRHAISTSYISKKQTFLKYFLEKLDKLG